MPIDDRRAFEIDFRLRQKEARVPAGHPPRQRRPHRGARRRRRRRAGPDGEGVASSSPTAARPTSRSSSVKFDGFDGDARLRADGRSTAAAVRRPRRAPAPAAADAPMPALRKDQVGALRADAGDSGRRARQRAVLAPRGRGRPLHLRRRRAVRPAVPADAVLRPGDARRCRAARRSLRRCRCSIATKATSSAARSERSCWWCRRSSVRVSPEVAIIPPPVRAARPAVPRARVPAAAPPRPAAAASRRRLPPATRDEIRVTVVNDTPGAADTS